MIRKEMTGQWCVLLSNSMMTDGGDGEEGEENERKEGPSSRLHYLILIVENEEGWKI